VSDVLAKWASAQNFFSLDKQDMLGKNIALIVHAQTLCAQAGKTKDKLKLKNRRKIEKKSS